MYKKVTAVLLCGIAAACARQEPQAETSHDQLGHGAAITDTAHAGHAAEAAARAEADVPSLPHDHLAAAADPHAQHPAVDPGHRHPEGERAVTARDHAHGEPADRVPEAPHADHAAAVAVAADTADDARQGHHHHADAVAGPEAVTAEQRPEQPTAPERGHAHAAGEPAAHDHPAEEASPGHGDERGREAHDEHHHGDHQMLTRPVGRGWSVRGMAQVFPIVTWGAPSVAGSPLNRTSVYATQPVAMLNLESRGSRFVLRFTPNFEGLTIPDGELTFGGWGEGFIDSRHPHTLLHELMASANLWDVGGAAFSLSAGRGFAPYGTDDPMSRPALKYPTNHHLSQVLERWTVNAILLAGGWSLEAGIFGGAEPKDAYDLSNIESFGDSWSARLTRRFGGGFGPQAPWEVSASYAFVQEAPHDAEGHHVEKQATRLFNAATRHAGRYGFGDVYALVEASRSDPRGDEEGHFSILGEAQLGLARHRPYARLELATRPEYARDGDGFSDGFFRYDHDGHTIGATRWLISSLGYGYEVTGYPISGRPFVEVNHHRVSRERGPATLEPERLFGARSFWSVSAGMRIFLGGDPMRMGAYGVLDPISVGHRPEGTGRTPAHEGHQTHGGNHD